MSERSWFVAFDGKQEGPLPESQISAMIRAGRITRDTLVWTDGMTDWQRADASGFLFSAQPPSPPSLSPPKRFSPLPGGPDAPAVEPRGAAIVAEFGVWPLFGRSLLVVAGILLVIPAPWIVTRYYRWFFSMLRLPTVPAAGFGGRPADIWWVFILDGLLIYVGLGHHWYVRLAVNLADIVLAWLVLRWVVANITSEGNSLSWRFEGSVWANIGWLVLASLSVVTIIGWAWVMSAQGRWIARNIIDPTRTIFFNGSGWQILWRTILSVFACCFVIPIPWVLHWYVRWLISQYSIVEKIA